MRQRVWILFCVYKKAIDDKSPLNFVTSIYSTKELAQHRQREIEDTRDDIAYVTLQENNIQTPQDYPELLGFKG